MTLNEQTEERVYQKLRAFDGISVGGHEPVNSSIASVLAEGEALADNGERYESIQNAIASSDSFTFVGPGTFYENVTIDKDDFMLQGAGYDTLIDGGTTGDAISGSGSNLTITGVRVTTNVSNGGFGIHITNNNCSIEGCFATDTGDDGFAIEGDYCSIINCTGDYSNSTDNTVVGLQTQGLQTIIVNNTIKSSVNTGIYVYGPNGGHDSIVANNTVFDAGSNGIYLQVADDNVVGGNRIHNSSDDGINIGGVDNIIYNNRISGSSGSNINTNQNSSGTVTDGNLTGSAN